jgi:hypothetical protein
LRRVGGFPSQNLQNAVESDGVAIGLVQFRLHPERDFITEEGQCAGHENRKHQPAQQQSRPGMQPAHRLA